MGACQSNTKASKPKQNPSDAQPVAVGDGGKTILAGEPVAKAEPNSESKETNAENGAGISGENAAPSSEEVKQDSKKTDGGEADAKGTATTAKEEEGAKAVGVEMSNDDVKGNVPITEEAQTVTENANSKNGHLREHASVGVIRLDYNYPPALGDIDHSGSFAYDVFYRVVPGLTFEMCQSGVMTEEVKNEFIEAVKWLDAKGVSCITGDCGFMMYFQELARKQTTKPVFMSALAQLPSVTCSYANHELIAIFTANSETLEPMRSLIKDECGVDTHETRYIIVGCQDVPGFEAVAAGDKVDVEKVTPGIVQKAKDLVNAHPRLRAILMECTELPPYSDAVRHATGLPVFDAITTCNSCIRGFEDNKRFGLNGWRKKWDGTQDAYSFGDNLETEDLEKLQTKA